MNEIAQERPKMDEFDRAIGGLDGLPDVLKTNASVIRVVPTMGLGTNMWVIQTFRQKDKGDTIFVEQVSKDGTIRLIVPPKVADKIARQREALTAKSRSKAMKAAMEERMANGFVPNFKKQ